MSEPKNKKNHNEEIPLPSNAPNPADTMESTDVDEEDVPGSGDNPLSSPPSNAPNLDEAEEAQEEKNKHKSKKDEQDIDVDEAVDEFVSEFSSEDEMSSNAPNLTERDDT